MANQAIALQARAPQSNFLGQAVQQNAQMINMLAQQRTAERQAAVAAQEMAIARAAEARAAAKEGRDIGEFELKQIKEVAAYFRDGLASWAQPGDVASTQALRDEVVRMIPAWDKIIPSAEALANNPQVRQRATMKAEEILNFSFAKPEASFQLGEDGRGFGVTVGGMAGPTAQEVIVQPPAGAAPAPTPTASARAPMSAPATDAQIDEAARKIIGGAGVGELGISMEDFDRATARANQMTAGGGARMQPVSMTTGGQMGGQPDMTAVVQDMMSSGQISQSNLQLMREMAGPDKDAQLAQILKANNIQIVPDDQPQMRSAVFRPGEDAGPRMQLAQAVNAPGTQFRGKDPMQSPAPGTTLVDPAIIAAQERARAQAAKDVEAKAAPVIAGATKRAERLETLRGDIPAAKNATQSLIADIDDRISSIDRLLRHPYRSSIIGPIEGRIPGFFQTPTRADVQALFDKIKNTATLTELTKLKTSTETGGSPLGSNPTDRDARIVETAASALIQTGDAREFEAELQRLRNKLYRLRDTAVSSYNDTYREILPEEPSMKLRVPSIAPKYEPKPKTKTQTRRAAPQQGWGKAEVVGD